MDQCALFTNMNSIEDAAKEHLQAGGVSVLPYEEIWSRLASWGQQLSESRGTKAPSPEPQDEETKEGEPRDARPTHKASLSGKTSWAVAEAMGKVSLTYFSFVPYRNTDP
jgi:hypothetical protein